MKKRSVEAVFNPTAIELRNAEWKRGVMLCYMRVDKVRTFGRIRSKASKTKLVNIWVIMYTE